MMPLEAGSELGDELLGLVQLAAEPVPPLDRAPREPPARVAGVQLADRRHPLPLQGSELRDGRRLVRRAVSALPSPSRPHESYHGLVPGARGDNQRARAGRGWRASSSIDSLAAAPELAADDAMAAVTRSLDADHRSAAERTPGADGVADMRDVGRRRATCSAMANRGNGGKEAARAPARELLLPHIEP
jgi:hypothetical protein